MHIRDYSHVYVDKKKPLSDSSLGLFPIFSLHGFWEAKDLESFWLVLSFGVSMFSDHLMSDLIIAKVEKLGNHLKLDH